MQNPAYLTLSEYNVYHFRWPIPLHLLPQGQRRYVKLSLGTREPKLALYLAKGLSCNAEAFLKRIELKGMDYSELKELVQVYLQRTLAEAKERMDWLGPDSKETILHRIAAENPDFIDTIQDSETETEYLKLICRKMEVPEIIEEEPEWSRLKQCFRQAYPQYAKAWLKQAEGFDFNVEPSSPIIVSSQVQSIRLAEAVTKYVEAHVQDKVWDANTTQSRQAYLALLEELIGSHYRLTFHSFRHTAVTRLYQAGVPQPIVETLVGHERAGTSQQVYFKEGYKLSQLKEAMDKYDPLAA